MFLYKFDLQNIKIFYGINGKFFKNTYMKSKWKDYKIKFVLNFKIELKDFYMRNIKKYWINHIDFLQWKTYEYILHYFNLFVK